MAAKWACRLHRRFCETFIANVRNQRTRYAAGQSPDEGIFLSSAISKGSGTAPL